MPFLNKSVEKMFPALHDDLIRKWGGIPIVVQIIVVLKRCYRAMKKTYVARRQAPDLTKRNKTN